MAKAEQLRNTGALATGFERFRRERALGTPEQQALERTRQSMEQPRPDADAAGDRDPDVPENADQADYDVGFACTPDRRSGRTKPMPTTNDAVAFHVPTVDAALDLAQLLQDKIQANETVLEFFPWMKATLESWAVESEYDEGYWGSQDPDTVRALVRGLTNGGNANPRSAA